MYLSKLLEQILPIPSSADRDIRGMTLDSRLIQKNDLFFAICGSQLDGRQYISEAITRGATVVLTDANHHTSITWQHDIPVIPIPSLKQHVGPLAARFYDYPSKLLRMAGVTGTNGKTTCCHFLGQILPSLGLPCGIIGTLGNGFYGELGSPGLTTPDAVNLQRTLREFANKGSKAVAMEVSSHSIDQGRINGTEFEVGLFTNLTQDHLDYHGTMEAYASVKHRFLSESLTKQIIINMDDPKARTWVDDLANCKPTYGYSLNSDSFVLSSKIPMTYADNIRSSLTGIDAYVRSPWGEGDLTVPLIGQFNLSNALAVLTVLCVYGLPFETICHHIKHLKSVPGRMQMLGGKNKPLAIVDYCHTPDALKNALQALRTHSQGKIICVFGAGGDRDHGKRPLMAEMVERYADRIIVTNDNPRNESASEIAKQIMKGFSHPEQVTIELNRSKAIGKSIQWASVNDCVLIAGKGAERYQQIGNEKIPFDDVEVVLSYLSRYAK